MKIATVQRETVGAPPLQLFRKATVQTEKEREHTRLLGLAEATIPVDTETISLWDLSCILQLTTGKTQELIAELRDGNPPIPLITGVHGGYYYTTDPDAIAAFKRHRMRTALTTIRRLWQGAIKPQLKELGDENLELLYTRQFERVIEDITMLSEG